MRVSRSPTDGVVAAAAGPSGHTRGRLCARGLWPLAGLAVAGGGAILELAPAPFVWIGLLLVLVLGAGAARARSQTLRLVLVNVAAVAAALGAFEAYLWLDRAGATAERFTGSYTTDYAVAHDVLGYGPRKGVRAGVAKYHGDELIYRTVYTIDERGLRVVPQPPDAVESVLFFGGSITFGEGVADGESMPYRVAARAGDRYAVHNFGFHGYGAHQMLAALEHALVEELVSQPPAAVIYQAIPAHIGRSSGRASWDLNGPRYRLDGLGRVYLAGRFGDDDGSWWSAVGARLERSLAYLRILGRERPMSEEELRLYLAIVEAARTRAESRFPGSRFHVLLWGDEGEPLYDRLLTGLRAAGIDVHPVKDILPRYRAERLRYELSPGDRHPNAYAHDLVAGYVSREILKLPPDSR